jgi:hypothetical protein
MNLIRPESLNISVGGKQPAQKGQRLTWAPARTTSADSSHRLDEMNAHVIHLIDGV